MLLIIKCPFLQKGGKLKYIPFFLMKYIKLINYRKLVMDRYYHPIYIIIQVRMIISALPLVDQAFIQ